MGTKYSFTHTILHRATVNELNTLRPQNLLKLHEQETMNSLTKRTLLPPCFFWKDFPSSLIKGIGKYFYKANLEY